MEEQTDREAIRASLSTMSFEELQKLKEDMGTKLYNETVLNIKSKKANTKTDFKRANKNRPREMTSKRCISTIQNIIPIKKTVVRDPRFDPLCGNFEEKTFQKNYKFIDKIKKKEKETLVKELRDTEDEKRQTQIKYLIQRMDNQQREKSRREKKTHETTVEKEETKEQIKKGEKPQYQKKSDKRMMELLNRYEELKQSKKLKKHIEKKSRKAAVKEKIKLKTSMLI